MLAVFGIGDLVAGGSGLRLPFGGFSVPGERVGAG